MKFFDYLKVSPRWNNIINIFEVCKDSLFHFDIREPVKWDWPNLEFEEDQPDMEFYDDEDKEAFRKSTKGLRCQNLKDYPIPSILFDGSSKTHSGKNQIFEASLFGSRGKT